MTSTEKTPRTIKRWTSAAAVIGSTVAVLASPLALGSASAAVGTMAFNGGQQSQTYSAGSGVSIAGTATGFTAQPAVTFNVTAGPDAGATGTCANPTATTFNCSFANLNASNGDAGLADSVDITGTHAGDTSNSPITATISFTSVPAIANDTEVDLGSVNTVGNSSTIAGTYKPVPSLGQSAPQIEYSVVGGPDVVSGGAGTSCTTLLSGHFSCVVNATHGPGTDSVEVFSDNNSDNKISAGEANATTYVFGSPTTMALLPANTTSPTGTCAPFTASAADVNGHPLAGQPLNINVTETASTNPGAGPITLYASDCSTVIVTGGSVSGTGPYTVSFTGPVSTGPDGNANFGLSATTVGSGTIVAKSASNPLVTSQTQNITWTAGGADAVASLSANPTSSTGYVNTQPSFTVTAKDSAGHGIQGVQVFEQVTSGQDSLGVTACNGLTNNLGAVVCNALINANHITTDTLQFWVNNNSPGAHTPGPDAGEPQTTATATFQAQPTFSVGNSTLTCVDQHVGPNQNKPAASCILPTSATAVVFTATIKDSTGAPVSGVVVNFAANSATLGGNGVTGANLPTGTATTDASGKAVFTVPNATPKNGDSISVTDKVGTQVLQTASASWQTPTAFALALKPPLQSVTKGGTVNVTAQVTDQFGGGVTGAKVVTFSVAGRNNGATGVKTTDASGSATYSYTDLGVNNASNQDTITGTDTTDNFPPVTATVLYISGPSTASTVAVDSSGQGTTDPGCNAAGHTPITGVALSGTTEVCVLVKNSAGETLAGKNVTMTVGTGQVDAHGSLSTSSTNMVTVATDQLGVAFFDVTSTKSGVQTISAAADTVTGSSTVTYAPPGAALARNIKIAPTPVNVASGAQQKFTATVTDAYGNAVPNASVLFTQTGPGNIGGNSSATLTTDATGTASVTVTTAATDTGSGSVVASLAAGAGGTQCGQLANAGAPPAATAGNCTATATYTVAKSAVPTSLTVQVAGANHVGKAELIAATVTNSDGSPAVNQLVRFTVSGANSASGSGVTSAKGVAFIEYTPTRAGTDHIAAYDDANSNGVKDAGEPSGTFSYAVLGNAHERPAISLTSRNGMVTIHVTSRPSLSGALVTYYIERLGRFHAIGSNRTGFNGRAHKSFREKVGQQFTFRVHVAGKSGVAGGNSGTKSIRVQA